MKKIFRYEVPADGLPHKFTLSNNPHHVDCRNAETVEFWALHEELSPVRDAWFMVVGTGHPLPNDFRRIFGTVVAPGDMLVWHLIEIDAQRR